MLRILALVVPVCARDIKVLSFTGIGTGYPVSRDVSNQHMCFEKDLIPGVSIRGTMSAKINAQTLEGYDVLLMPGGIAEYQMFTDRDAIRAFVKAGGGYYGTCAGALAGCKNSGMGVSNATCGPYESMGTTHNVLTPEGRRAFPNQPAVVDIDHHNGPAMNPNGATTLATFHGGMFAEGKASIVGDTYGAGKVILVSPHPEHEALQNCDIVTYMAAYAAGVDVSAYVTV